jgi:hypothetical protein
MNQVNKILLKIILLLNIFNIQCSKENEKYNNQDQQEETLAEPSCACSCKKYKKHRFTRKKPCEHKKCCCCKKNRAVTGGILGGILGAGTGAAIGASATPATIGTGAAIGGPIGIVGGVLLSQIL